MTMACGLHWRTFMRPTLIFVFAASLLVGCASNSHIRREAKITLECGSVDLQRDEAHDVYIADGCGRRAICTLPKVENAEPMCVGGAPIVASY